MISSLLQPFASGSSRRAAVVLLAGVGIAAIWVFSQWASTPTYVPIYRDLDPKEAGTIAEALRKSGIAHQLGAGGGEVLVPAAEAARARVTLARDGLPVDGRPGLELFDKPAWGMTDFTQRVTYQRALEGELSRTIGGLRGIERAQVHLVLPASSPLRRLERPATASVVLTLERGVTLSPEAVRGITFVVSNSVEQLASESVAVMDDTGRLLSVPSGPGSTTGAATRQLEIQQTLERQLAEKVEALLTTVVGLGRSRVEIAADMNFDQVDRTVESFDPDGQVIANEQRSESEGGSGSGAETVYNNSYQNSRRVERESPAVGRLTRLSVAVMVDEQALVARADAGGVAAQLARLESLVRSAVGADSARGDVVAIAAVPFQPVAAADLAADAAAATPPADPVVLIERFGRPTVNVLAIVALVVVVLAAIRGLGAAGGAGAAASGSLAPAVAGAAAPGATALAGPREVAALPPAPAAGANGDDPAANVVRAWLGDS